MTGEILWTAGAFFTNPGANTTLVQSAALSPGIYEINVTIYCTSMAMFIVQQIDTDGVTIIKSQRIGTDISSMREINRWKTGITSNGQKIRVITPEAIIGDVQVSLS